MKSRLLTIIFLLLAIFPISPRISVAGVGLVPTQGGQPQGIAPTGGGIPETLFPARVEARSEPPVSFTQKTANLFTSTDCPFTNPGGYQIDCGYLSVPEDHAAPEGKQIRLAMAIARSPNPNKAPDPILYLHGGPGGEIVSLVPYLINRGALTAMLQQRDVILVDQRGMGHSEPLVNCPVFYTPKDILTLSSQEITRRMDTCPAQLEARGIRWQLYTTDQNAADLAMIGPALGYARVNLFGVSYGTLLALLILRNYPEVVRSAALDSVLPPGVSTYEQSAQWNDHSVSLVEAHCQADWVCRLAYPNLRQEMLATYERLKARPAAIEVEGETVMITAHYFASHAWGGSLAEVEALPAFVRAIANEDYEVAKPLISRILKAQPSEMPNLALFGTMACPYQAGITSPERIATASAPYAELFQDARFNANDWWRCQAWSELPLVSFILPHTGLPVLLMAGEYDVLTPFAWAQYATQGLSHAQVFEIPYTGHNVTGVGGEAEKCTAQLVTSFYAEPSVALDASCLRKIPGPAFVLGASVTRFPIQVALFPLTLVALFSLGAAAYTWRKSPRWVAWRAAFWQMGFMPLISLVIVVGWILASELLMTDTWLQGGILAAVVPLLMALQATGVFSVEEEPALEITLVAPRPLSWLIVERLVATTITYTLIALVGAVIILWKGAGQFTGPSILVILFSWVAPALFLSGVGLYVSVRTRLVALGMVTVLALWIVFGLFARFFLPGLSFPFPLNLIQPFLWPVHIAATLQDLGPADFWLNRLFLSNAGVTLLWLAVRAVGDSENLLLHARNRKRGFFLPSPPGRGQGVAGSKKLAPQKRKERKEEEKEEKLVLLRKTAFSLLLLSFFASFASLRCKLRSILQHSPGGEGRRNGTPTPFPVRPLAVAQIIGITVYEFRMLWRQRAMRVFAMTPIVLFLAMVALNIVEKVISPAILSVLSGEQRGVIYGEFLAWLLAPFILSLVLWLYPLLMSNQVPFDQRIGVTELLRVLPMGDGSYLAGKILGATLVGGSALLLTAIVSSIVWFLRVGAFYPIPALNVLSLSLLLLAVTTAQGVLLGATQNSTQRALVLILAVMIVPELLQTVSLIKTLLPGSAEFLNLSVEASLQATLIMPPLWRSFDPLAGSLAVLYGGLILKTAILTLLVWGWRKLRTSKT
jgi:pimeloyl-ACP methyl ester carboxylesterase